MSKKSFQDLQKRHKYNRLNELLARINEDYEIDNDLALDQQPANERQVSFVSVTYSVTYTTILIYTITFNL